jgi:hypothetical protein
VSASFGHADAFTVAAELVRSAVSAMGLVLHTVVGPGRGPAVDRQWAVMIAMCWCDEVGAITEQ